MRYYLRIEVRLKAGHSDPEGETTCNVLKELGYDIDSVRVGKIYKVVLKAGSQKEAASKANEMCKRLLANPTKDDYVVTVEEMR
jgi:phosphoribosylformylglycinamidine synthase PurS subunit